MKILSLKAQFLNGFRLILGPYSNSLSNSALFARAELNS